MGNSVRKHPHENRTLSWEDNIAFRLTVKCLYIDLKRNVFLLGFGLGSLLVSSDYSSLVQQNDFLTLCSH
jgi:hypothetical protein